MHFAFIPYGKRSEVELFFRDLEAQKHYMKMFKDGVEKKIAIQGQLRLLPFGICEYVFPKEDADLVLHTMINEMNRYKVSTMILRTIAKFLKLQKIPEYKKTAQYLWIKDNVNIIPLGVRYDEEIVEPKNMPYTGWRHEAI